MYQKQTKIIASIIVCIMMFTYMATIGEVIAVNFESQTAKTNHANIEFDSYFMKGNQKIHSDKKVVGEENNLYTSIKVKEAGYLKNIVVEAVEANFQIAEKIEDDRIEKVEGNKLFFNQIKNGNTVEIAIPIQILQKEAIKPEELSKEAKVRLTATYVDGKGEEKAIEKEITVSLAWTAEKQAELTMQIAKYIPYDVNHQKGLVLQTIVKSYLQNNILPVKENQIEISVPTINGIKPEEVKVTTNTTKATKEGAEVVSTYNKETNKLIINVKNEPDEQGIIAWQKNAEDEFVVTYQYAEEALNSITAEGTKIVIEASSELTICEETETKVTKDFAGEATLKDPISSLVEFTIKTNIEEVSKGQIYANKQADRKLETSYQETITANIGLAELTDKIIINRQADNFILEDSTKITAGNATYYKTLELDKENFDKMLGEEGSINVLQGTNLISTIDSKTESNEQGKIEVDLTSFNTSSLTIETSKPQVEGKLDILLTKAVKGDISYSNTQMKAVKGMELSLEGTAINEETNFVEQELSKQIALTEPTSQAELTISNGNLSTVVTNENVKLTAILKTDTEDCLLYKDPTIQIILPNYIEHINVKNVELFFNNGDSKLEIQNVNVSKNEAGTNFITLELKGTQTEYMLEAVSKGVNIVVTADIQLNQFTPNKQDEIIMRYTNRNDQVEGREVRIPINIVAPIGVITTTTLSNYAEEAEAITAISGEEKLATIPILSEARNTEFGMTVINNYTNTIDEVSILGRIPSKGNKNIETQEAFGSTMDMLLTGNIEVNGVDASKVTIYYSENAEATKELNKAENGWKETPSNLEQIKSYLIVLTDHTMNTGDRVNFSYTAQIPENLQHNEVAKGHYVVYFNNHLETGDVQDKQVATTVGVTTGRGPVIETDLTTTVPKAEEVLTGNIIPYTITVKNTGTEVAKDVMATIELPQGLQYVELENDSYVTKQVQGEVQIPLGNIEAGQTVTKEVNLKVGILSALDDTKVVEVKATITASNIAKPMETKTVENTLVRTHFITASTVLTEKEVLKENDEYTYHMEITSSGLSETRENGVLTVNFPTEIEYQEVEIKNKEGSEETDITSTISYQYDSKTRTLTIPLGNIEGMSSKIIYLKVKVGTLAENVYDKTVNIDAKVSAKDARTQDIEVKEVQVGKIGFKTTQSSNIPENTHITMGEDLKYIFTIENLSSVRLYNVKITDLLPEGLILKHMTVTRKDGTTTNSYNNAITINLEPREVITLEVNVVVDMLEETKTISNKAKIEYEEMNPIETSSYTLIIDKFDSSTLEDPNNPSNPDKQTKRIMGTVWVDENANGARDEKEEKVSNVDMLLFNNQTGNLVTNSSGNLIRTSTDENGSYTLAGIKPGKYTVIFLYDTANYSATTYRKEGVNETMNSDAVDSKITLDGVTRIAAITEEVNITDTNIYNIDLGLVKNPKFDLKLDKMVSKITVQDSTGTKVYEYNDSKLAKKDLVGKQINNTTIIVEYKIKITNEGAISGFVKKIADYMPSEMKFSSELNKDWYSSENGTLYNASLANTLINPGESKEVTLLLTKKMTENNLGLYHNQAEIYESYNDLGIQDIDSVAGNKASNEDDISSADVLISVKTGEAILFVGLSLTIITIIGTGAYFIKKKVLR